MSRYWKKIPSFKSLLAVEAIDRLGSFSKAGEELNVGQSAVSHAVRNLEEALGVVLIERGRRPVRMTEAGKRYVETIRSGLSDLEHAYDIVRPPQERREVVVSGNLGVITYWLIPRLKVFRALNPDIGVSFVTTYDGVPSLDMEIDIALRFGDGNWPDCESLLLFDEKSPQSRPRLIWPAAPLSTRQPIFWSTRCFRCAQTIPPGSIGSIGLPSTGSPTSLPCPGQPLTTICS